MPTILYCWLRLLGLRANYCLCATNFAGGFNVLFNAKKSKCLSIRPKKDDKSNCSLKPMSNIGGNAIEFLRQWPQIGNLINDICDDKDDILKKRNTVCGQMNIVLCFW